MWNNSIYRISFYPPYKNTKIPDDSIVGWGSIVTKVFHEPNIILAGIPAKIIKRGINWDRRYINKYLL